MYAETSKNEDTWCETLRHLRCRIKFNPDVSHWLFEGWWYGWRLAWNRNADGNLVVRYLNWYGNRWDWNYNWLDNDWNDNNPAALSATLFVSLSALCRESFGFLFRFRFPNISSISSEI